MEDTRTVSRSWLHEAERAHLALVASLQIHPSIRDSTSPFNESNTALDCDPPDSMNQPLDTARADRAHNLVVLSDVHLGEDLMPGCPAETRRHVDMAETAMVDFIRHLARWRVDGRPWRLVTFPRRSP